MSSPTVSTKLARIAAQSARNPDLVFTNLAHHMDVEFVRAAFGRVRPDAAPGVDGVTWATYEVDLPSNLLALHARLKEGRLFRPDTGTPQGGVISPLLANIYLHHVLDEWFPRVAQPRLRGASVVVRFADDFVVGCVLRSDAERVFHVLPKRFARYALAIHPAKSRLVQFSRPYWKCGKGTGTFDFLGFTHYWCRTLSGGWTIRRKTRRPRLHRALHAIWTWCRDHRHWSVPEQHRCLCAKLRGHYAFYGVRGNYKALEVVFEYAEQAWKHWLGRRTRNGYLTCDVFASTYRRAFPLPLPRIVHSC